MFSSTSDYEREQALTSNYEALCFAIRTSYLEKVEQLLEIPEVCELAAAKNNKALHIAIHASSLAIIERLLKIPAVFEQAAANNSGLYSAIGYGRLDVVEKFLQIPAMCEQVAGDNNAIFRRVAEKGYSRIVAQLLKIPAVFDQVTANNNNALHFAIKYDRPEIVELLLQVQVVREQAAVNNNAALRCAVEYNRLWIVEELLKIQEVYDHAAVNDNAALRSAVVESSREIVELLLKIPVVSAQAAANNNEALRSVIENNRSEIVELLLQVPVVREQAAVNDNAALRCAVENNHLWIVEELLQIQEVYDHAAVDNNAALHSAVLYGYTEIAERLRQIPSVAALENQQPLQQELSLADEAAHSENSMLELTPAQRRLIETLQQHYQDEYEDKTWDVLSAEIKSFLEGEYSKHPVIVEPGNALPLEFTSELSEASLLAYYQHRIHTAWRYLSRPNPWMSPQAQWVENVEDGRAAAISEGDKALMGYIWLALNDKTVELAEGFTVEANKILFAENLSLLGRAHNWDNKRPILDAAEGIIYKANGKPKRENFDDLRADKPSCGMGVTQRLLKVFYGHPYVNGSEARMLNAEIMREFMVEHLVKTKAAENAPDNLFDRLNMLSVVILKDIHQELSDLLDLCEVYKERDLTDDEHTFKANALATPEAQLQAFIERCKLWFGDNRINASATVCYEGHDTEHAGYIPLIQHSLVHPIMAFSAALNTFLTKKIAELELQAKAAPTFLPNYAATSSSGTVEFEVAASSSNDCVDDVSRRAEKRSEPEASETRASQAAPRRSERLRRRRQ